MGSGDHRRHLPRRARRAGRRLRGASSPAVEARSGRGLADGPTATSSSTPELLSDRATPPGGPGSADRGGPRADRRARQRGLGDQRRHRRARTAPRAGRPSRADRTRPLKHAVAVGSPAGARGLTRLDGVEQPGPPARPSRCRCASSAVPRAATGPTRDEALGCRPGEHIDSRVLRSRRGDGPVLSQLIRRPDWESCADGV